MVPSNPTGNVGEGTDSSLRNLFSANSPQKIRWNRINQEKSNTDDDNLENNGMSPVAALPVELVVYLTSPSKIDYSFLTDFLLIFREFLDCHTLLSWLFTRITCAIRESCRNKSAKSQLYRVVLVRCFVILRCWLLNYFPDDFVPSMRLRTGFCKHMETLSRIVSKLPISAETRRSEQILFQINDCWMRQISRYWQFPVSSISSTTGTAFGLIWPGGNIGSLKNEHERIHRSRHSLPDNIADRSFLNQREPDTSNSGHVKSFAHGTTVIPSSPNVSRIELSSHPPSDNGNQETKPNAPLQLLWQSLRSIKSRSRHFFISDILDKLEKRHDSVAFSNREEKGQNSSYTHVTGDRYDLLTARTIDQFDRMVKLCLNPSLLEEEAAEPTIEGDQTQNENINDNEQPAFNIPGENEESIQTDGQHSFASPDITIPSDEVFGDSFIDMSCSSSNGRAVLQNIEPSSINRMNRIASASSNAIKASGEYLNTNNANEHEHNLDENGNEDRIMEEDLDNDVRLRELSRIAVSETTSISTFAPDGRASGVSFRENFNHRSSSTSISGHSFSDNSHGSFSWLRRAHLPSNLSKRHGRTLSDNRSNRSYMSYNSDLSDQTYNRSAMAVPDYGTPYILKRRSVQDLRSQVDRSAFENGYAVYEDQTSESQTEPRNDDTGSTRSSRNDLEAVSTSDLPVNEALSKKLMSHLSRSTDYSIDLLPSPSNSSDDSKTASRRCPLPGISTDILGRLSQIPDENFEGDVLEATLKKLEGTYKGNPLEIGMPDSLFDSHILDSTDRSENMNRFFSGLYGQPFSRCTDRAAGSLSEGLSDGHDPDVNNNSSSSDIVSIEFELGFDSHIPFVLRYSSLDIAKQMTLIERDALLEIDWLQLIGKNWEHMVETSDNWLQYIIEGHNHGVEFTVARFNLVSDWVVSEILLTRNLNERVMTICKFIHIAKEALEMLNLPTFMQITLALSSVRIERLTTTWQHMPNEDLVLFDHMTSLASPWGNFKELRALLDNSAATKGCVPFIGVYLADLTALNEIPASLPADPDNNTIGLDQEPLVNVIRYRRCAKIVKELMQYMSWSRSYTQTIKFDQALSSRCLYIGRLTESECQCCMARMRDP